MKPLRKNHRMHSRLTSLKYNDGALILLWIHVIEFLTDN